MNNMIGKVFNFFPRIISTLVSITLLSTNFLVAPSYGMGMSTSSDRKLSLIDSFGVSVPQQFGKIQEVFKGSADQTVILVQDAHAIPDVQRNIQNLIGYFQKEYGLNLIALEGAAAELDPQIFRSFPDKEVLKKVFDEYMEKGEVTGSTAAAIFNPSTAIYRGVEDWSLYENGLGLYQNTMDKEQEIQAKINAEKNSLQKKKEATYSKELLEIDNALAAFHSNHGNLMDVMKKLAAIKAPEKGSELALLLEETNQDQENQIPQEIEVKKIAAEVKNALESSHASKADLASFNDKFQEFQTSHISAQAFAVFLEELAFEKKLSLEVSDRLSYLMKNQKKMRDIEGTRLFNDLKQYAKLVKNLLFKNDEEKKLDQQAHILELLEGINRLELSREDWNELKEISLDSSYQELLKPHFAFYENAQTRDEVFFKNLMDSMTKHQSKASLLVAGGFHAESLIQKFKDQEISYILLMPQINSIPENSRYREHIKGDVSWKDYYQVENGKVDLYKAFVRGTRDALLKGSKEESHQLLKKWRDQIVRDLAQREKITKVQEYTLFLDETASKNQEPKSFPEWRVKVEQFIEGLRELDSQGQLTEQTILNLFKPSTHADLTYPVDVPGNPPVDASYLRGVLRNVVEGQTPSAAGRSEVRAFGDFIGRLFGGAAYWSDEQNTGAIEITGRESADDIATKLQWLDYMIATEKQTIRWFLGILPSTPNINNAIDNSRKTSKKLQQFRSNLVQLRSRGGQNADDLRMTMLGYTYEQIYGASVVTSVVTSVAVERYLAELKEQRIEQDKTIPTLKLKMVEIRIEELINKKSQLLGAETDPQTQGLNTQIDKLRALQQELNNQLNRSEARAVIEPSDKRLEGRSSGMRRPDIGKAHLAQSLIFQRSEVRAANPSIGEPIRGQTLADLYYDLALQGKPIGVTPDAILARVKQLTREARKRIDLNVIIPNFRDFLQKTLAAEQLGDENRKIIETVLNLLDAHGLAGRHLESAQKGWMILEQHKQYVAKQEQTARTILQQSGLLDRLAIPNIDYYVHVRSYHEEHALLAPFFRAFLVLAAIVYQKNDLAEIQKGIELYRAIQASGAIENLRIVENYVAGIGRVENVLPTTVIDKNIWAVDAILDLIKVPTVGADKAHPIGQTAAPQRTGLRIVPQTVDVINKQIQTELESGRRASVDIPLEVLTKFTPDQIKSLGGSSAEVLLSTLGVILDETKGYTPDARKVIVANVIAAYADQNEETLLFRELPTLLRDGSPAGPRPSYNGIYALALPRTYAELAAYIKAEVEHFNRIVTSGKVQTPRELSDLIALGQLIERLRDDSSRYTGANATEQMIRVNEELGQAIFELISKKKLGDKLPVIGEIAYDTGVYTYLANGEPAKLTWQSVDGQTVYGGFRYAYEFPSGNVISSGDWRDKLDRGDIPQGRRFPIGTAAPSTVMTHDAIDRRINGIPLATRPGLAFRVAKGAAILNVVFTDTGKTVNVNKVSAFTAYDGDVYVESLGALNAFQYQRMKRTGAIAQLSEAQLPGPVAKDFGVSVSLSERAKEVEGIVGAFNESVRADNPGLVDSELPFSARRSPVTLDLVEDRDGIVISTYNPGYALRAEIQVTDLIRITYLPKTDRRNYPVVKLDIKDEEDPSKLKSYIVYRDGTMSVVLTDHLAFQGFRGIMTVLAQKRELISEAGTMNIAQAGGFYINSKTRKICFTRFKGEALVEDTIILELVPVNNADFLMVAHPNISITRATPEDSNSDIIVSYTNTDQNVHEFRIPSTASARSEVRQVAVEVVDVFKDNGQNFDLGNTAKVIVAAGVEVFIPELYAAVEDATREEDITAGVDTKAYFEAIQAIDKPTVIEHNISEQDLARMGGNSEAIIRNLLQAAHDASATNKNIIARVSVPERIKNQLRLQDHNQKDAVRLEQIGSAVTLYNEGLEGHENFINAAPAITVTDSSVVNGTALLSDKYGNNEEVQYEGTEGSEVASKMFTAALVWVAESVSERTLRGLVQVDTNGYRIQSQNALNTMGYLVQAMAQYRAELRTSVAA